MRCGPAKESSILVALADIFERARIHQQASAIAHQRDAQGIGMAVARGPRSLRTSVDQRLLSGLGVSHQVKSALLESDGPVRRLAGLEFFEFGQPGSSEKP